MQALTRSLVPVHTEAVRLARSDARSSLQWHLHFFAGAPKAEQERIAACVQPISGSSSRDSISVASCADLMDLEDG